VEDTILVQSCVLAFVQHAMRLALVVLANLG
jgi:hypothetical protein